MAEGWYFYVNKTLSARVYSGLSASAAVPKNCQRLSGVFSQLELAMIRARARSGMANAAAKGAKIGRPQVTADNIPSGILRHYPAYRNGQLNVSELARVCDLSRTTVYKYIALLER